MQHQEAQPCLEVDGRLHLPRLACMEDLGGDRWNIMPSVTLSAIRKKIGRKCQTVRCLGVGWAHAVGAGRVRFGLSGMLRSRPLGITPPPLQAAPGDKELAALQLGHRLEKLLQEVHPEGGGGGGAGEGGCHDMRATPSVAPIVHTYLQTVCTCVCMSLQPSRRQRRRKPPLSHRMLTAPPCQRKHTHDRSSGASKLTHTHMSLETQRPHSHVV